MVFYFAHFTNTLGYSLMAGQQTLTLCVRVRSPLPHFQFNQKKGVVLCQISEARDSSDIRFPKWYLFCGNEFDDEGSPLEAFQYYIISSTGAEILRRWTDEIVYYNEDLDIYLWCVTHYGTSWDYVLTNIEIEEE